MHMGMVGLGKMGGNMARRLMRAGHTVVANDRDAATVAVLAGEGARPAATLTELVALLPAPRVVWLMLPAGAITQTAISELGGLLSRGDILIDGGNTYYKDDMRRAAELAAAGIAYIDCGTSGGVWGLTEGYCLMVGGPPEAVEHIRPLLASLAPACDQGWAYVGPVGAGHFVKMVHNGIEYGLMQAYAEGFEILKAKSDTGQLPLDLAQIAEVWRHGSVVRSWLLDLVARALAQDANLSGIRGWVADSGEGRWTVAEAIDRDVPAPVITLSLMARFASRQPESFAAKLLAALRGQFGGHEIKSASPQTPTP